MTVEVKDLDNVVYHFRKVITVLNKNGDEDAHVVIYHNINDIIKSVKGVIYNEFGQQVDKFSESKFDDESVGGSLFDSERVKHYLPPVTSYPYTVAYEYEEKSKQTLVFPDWMPDNDVGVAVENSSYTFICKPDFKIRYKETNLPSNAVITTNAQGQKVYSWHVGNLKALKREPFSPYLRDYASSVKIAPVNFIYYGIGGSFTNWAELGKWYNEKLMANRQALDYATIQHVKDITQGITDSKLKAKKIYEYMQSRTHYISVQVGIGGFQPFPAMEVDKESYGDCKALVNYTQALLKAADIDSYYCIVQAGRDHNVSLLRDFASMDQANHIILCVPFKNDTTWADCTSQTIPFGYLGDFTDDRTVLAITPEGGKLMRTPKYSAEANLESRKADFTINTDGALQGSMTTVFKGVNYENRDNLIKETRDEQTKKEQKRYPINNMEIESLNISQDKSFTPSTTETIMLRARDYATVDDGKYYFLLNPANRETYVPALVRNRVNDVYISRGESEVDEVTYTLPKGYMLEKKRLNINIDKPFGKFTASMELKDDKLTYKRKFQLNGGIYNKDSYQDLIDFFSEIVDADKYSVVLIKAAN
ncbi:MAG TPA: DUF3857 domain-containing protein [Mucilaginibacter sp.]